MKFAAVLLSVSISIVAASFVFAVWVPEKAFTIQFGFTPAPRTELKQELVTDHLNALSQACQKANSRFLAFELHPVEIRPPQVDNLIMRYHSLHAQMDELCILHATAIYRADRFGYIRHERNDPGGDEQGGTQ